MNSGMPPSKRFVMQFAKVVLREAIKFKTWVVLLFVVTSLVVLIAGVLSPKIYQSNVTVFADQAEPTDSATRERLTADLITSPRIIGQLVTELDLVEDPNNSESMDKAILAVISAVEIQPLGSGFIKIAYTADDSIHAYNVVSKLTDLIILDSIEANRRVSNESNAQIEKQAQAYKVEVQQAEEKLKQFNVADLVGTEKQTKEQLSATKQKIESIQLDIEETEIRITSLETQLSSESEFSAPKNPIDIDPPFRELRELIDTEKMDLASKKRRLKRTEAQLQEQLSRLERIAERQSELDELKRDYDITKTIYEGILARKEKARLSMPLDVEGLGVTYSIQEPASYPNKPMGIQFVHYAIFGPMLGFLLPFGLLAAYVKVDPRIRMPDKLSNLTDLPVLGVVPHISTPLAKRLLKSDVVFLCLFLVIVSGIYLSVAVAYQRGVI